MTNLLFAHRLQQFAVTDVQRVPQTGVVGLAIGIAAVLAILVDGTASNIFSTSLPYLEGRSAATPDEASWIITVFNAPYYSTILISPWMYARLGRKPLLLIAMGGFGVTSLLLALVQPLWLVIVLRFVQGFFLGAVYVPAAVLLFTSLPLNLLPFAPPFFASVVLGAGTLGTLFGGVLSEDFGASAVYVPSALATLAAAAIVYFAAPNLDKPQRLRVDLIGYGLSLLAFGALQYLSNEGERRNWFDDPAVTLAALILPISAVALVAWELYLTSVPHANFRLIAQKRNLAVGCVMNVILGIAGYSVISFAIYLETLVDSTETLAGELIALRLITYVIGIVTAFALVRTRRLTVWALVCIAALGSAVSFLTFGFQMTATAEAATFIGVTLVFGFFFSMLSQPVPALVLGSLQLSDLPAGLSLYKLSAPVGLSIGGMLFQTFLDHRTTLQSTTLAGYISLSRVPVQQFLADGGKLTVLASQLGQQAFALANENSMFVYAAIVLLTIPVIFFADVAPGQRR